MRCELERRGIVVRFCDECYWGDIQQPDLPECQEEALAQWGTPRRREAVA